MLEDLTSKYDPTTQSNSTDDFTELSFACFESLKGTLARNDFTKMISQWEKLKFTYILAYMTPLTPSIDSKRL